MMGKMSVGEGNLARREGVPVVSFGMTDAPRARASNADVPLLHRRSPSGGQPPGNAAAGIALASEARVQR